MVPNTADAKIPFELKYDEYGFIDGATDVDGVYAAGCAKRPCDVSRATKESTAAALKAIQCLNRGNDHMEDKIGVFICTGYGIAEALDIDALCKVATDEYNVPFCKTVDSCEGPGLESINEDIKNEGLTKVVIAGISPRRYAEDAFPEDVIVEKIALREHVVWCQPPGEEDTQMMAEDYLRMYIAKVQKMELLEPFQPEETIDKSILVVGGGITGMTAALGAAEAGYEVRLVEKTDKLGGWLAKQHKSVPTKPPYRELEDTGVDALIAEDRGESPDQGIYLGYHERNRRGSRAVRCDAEINRQRQTGRRSLGHIPRRGRHPGNRLETEGSPRHSALRQA